MGVISIEKAFNFPNTLDPGSLVPVPFSVTWTQNLHFQNLGVNNLTLKSLYFELPEALQYTDEYWEFFSLSNVLVESDLFDHKVRLSYYDNTQFSGLKFPFVMEPDFFRKGYNWEPHLHLGEVVNYARHSTFKLSFDAVGKMKNMSQGSPGFPVVPAADPILVGAPVRNAGPTKIVLLFEYDEEAVH